MIRQGWQGQIFLENLPLDAKRRRNGRSETGGREAREEAKEAEADSIRMVGTRRKGGDLTATWKVKQKLEVGQVEQYPKETSSISGLWGMDRFEQRGQELGCGCVTLESPGGVSPADGCVLCLERRSGLQSRGRGWLIDRESNQGHG